MPCPQPPSPLHRTACCSCVKRPKRAGVFIALVQLLCRAPVLIWQLPRHWIDAETAAGRLQRQRWLVDLRTGMLLWEDEWASLRTLEWGCRQLAASLSQQFYAQHPIAPAERFCRTCERCRAGAPALVAALEADAAAYMACMICRRCGEPWLVAACWQCVCVCVRVCKSIADHASPANRASPISPPLLFLVPPSPQRTGCPRLPSPLTAPRDAPSWTTRPARTHASTPRPPPPAAASQAAAA